MQHNNLNGMCVFEAEERERWRGAHTISNKPHHRYCVPKATAVTGKQQWPIHS